MIKLALILPDKSVQIIKNSINLQNATDKIIPQIRESIRSAQEKIDAQLAKDNKNPIVRFIEDYGDSLKRIGKDLTLNNANIIWLKDISKRLSNLDRKRNGNWLKRGEDLLEILEKGLPVGISSIKCKNPKYEKYVKSMVTLTKKYLSIPKWEYEFDDVEQFAMYVSDAAHALEVAMYIAFDNPKKAYELTTHMDTAEKENISNMVYNFLERNSGYR